MSKFKYVLLGVLLSTLVFVAYQSRHGSWDAQPGEHRDTVVIYDTIIDVRPQAVHDTLVAWHTLRVPAMHPDSVVVASSDTVVVYVKGDTANVDIPIRQRQYETKDYRAWVSGYRPSLDSIVIFRSTDEVHIRSPAKSKRFSVGVQAGYGMTPKGFQPFVGVGVSANLWSF